MNNEEDFGIKEKYEYELPGEPLNPTGEPLGRSMFINPSVVSSEVKYINPDQYSGLGHFKYWFISCAVMLFFGLVFEFGLLGKDGKEGPLCQYLPKNKVCYYLAGPVTEPTPVTVITPKK